VIHKRLVASLLLGLATLFILACSDGPNDSASSDTAPREVKKMTFLAGFKAQANLPFVGVYVAQEKGFFAEQALDVEIRHAQSGAVQLLLGGEVHVTTANGAQVVQRNAQGLEIVSIALIGQKSEQGYAVLADSGITSVRDWQGKTFGYRSTVPAEFLAVARAGGIDPASVRQVSAGFDARILTERQVDILPVFFSNEPDTLKRQGFDVRVFDPEDYGVRSLGLTYVASREFLEKDPKTLRRFVHAALKGIDYANTNREEALNIVMEYAPQEEREHQRFMLNAELDRAQTPLTRANGLGWQTREQWQALTDLLRTYNVIEAPVDVSRLYTDEFVKETYRDGQLIWP
jgi:ABC-type nitrate/sulfonate/bicarbonate transport system substrate-binding protein